MRTLGNIIWLIFGGLGIAIEYAISSVILMLTIVGIPFGIQTLKLASLAIWPMGQKAVKRRHGNGFLYLLMNIIWFFVGGFWIALSHIILSIVLAITIVGIPFAKQHIKLVSLAFSPFGRDIVKK